MYIEIYQILFYISITFIIKILIQLIMKVIDRFVFLDENAKFILNKYDKYILIIGIGIVLAYLI